MTKNKGKRATKEKPITDVGLIVHRFFSTMFGTRCPNCGEGKIGNGFFNIKPECPGCHAVFDRGDAGNFMVSATLNYLITAIILIVTSIALVRNYGFFPSMTWYIAGLALVVGALLYRPCKLLGVWILWIFGFIYS